MGRMTPLARFRARVRASAICNSVLVNDQVDELLDSLVPVNLERPKVGGLVEKL